MNGGAAMGSWLPRYQYLARQFSLRQKGQEMWWGRKVRYATVLPELRDRFEVFGEHVLVHAIAGGIINSPAQGVELIGLIQQNRPEILAWLTESGI